MDGGASWSPARLGPPPSRWAWRGWEWDWDVTEPGDYELCCRATDDAGNTQPLDPPWNLGGYVEQLRASSPDPRRVSYPAGRRLRATAPS